MFLDIIFFILQPATLTSVVKRSNLISETNSHIFFEAILL